MVQELSLVIPFPVIRLCCLGSILTTDRIFLGTEFNDLVSLNGGLTIFGQSIGGATDSFGFDGVDGILGYVVEPAYDSSIHPKYRIGPVGLTQGTLTPDTSDTIPTGES